MWSLPYCRLCGDPTSEKEAVNALDESAASLRYIIRLRLQMELPADQHSHLICSACIDRLTDFQSFSKKCYGVQIRLAQISLEDNSQNDDEKASVGIECNRAHEDANLHMNPKRMKLEITAENCDNIIIPETFTSTGNCDSIIVPEGTISENNDFVCSTSATDDGNARVDENLKESNARPKDKVPLSKLKDFFLSKIRPKENHLNNYAEGNLKCQDENQPEKEISDEGRRCSKNVQKRIPPKVNEDDIQCPYCRWYIPREEFNPDHLSFHVQDLNSEFHKLVMTIDSRTSLVESVVDSSIFRCDDCNKEFSDKLGFLEHRHCHEDRRVIACHLCSRAFFNRKRLRAHLCSIHLQKTFACEQCPYRTKNKPDMANHRIRVHTDARIQCPLCGKLIAAYPQNLTKHLETHKEVPEYECDLCPAAFKTKAGLRKHRENKHYPNPVMCSTCGTLCASRQKYSKHLSRCRRRNGKVEMKTEVQ